MRFLITFCLYFSFIQFSAAQDTAVLDSLAKASNDQEKYRLAVKVAKSLSDADWERMLFYVDLAREAAHQTGSPKTVADFHIEIGNIYYEKDVLDIALENYLEAYKFYETQSIADRYLIENNLAITYARTANQEKAIEYFKKIKEYRELQSDTFIQATLLNNMGRIWYGKNIDSSLYYFQKSEKLIDHIDETDFKIFLFTNIAVAYKEKNNLDLAEKYFNRALENFTDNSFLESKGWVYIELAEFHLRLKQEDTAVYYLKEAINILDSLAPYGFQNQRAVQLLYATEKNKGNFEEAFKSFEKYMTISDSINLEDKRINVERLLSEEKYRNKDKIRELENSRRKARNYIVFLIMLTVLLFLGILLLRFRNKLRSATYEKQITTLKKEELQSKLELKNQELIGKAMIELHRMEIIEEILNDLKAVKRAAIKMETRQTIDFIAKKLQREMSKDLWKEFELRFEEVHESFYDILLQRHPDLSLRERRLATLLKLNLSSKEIAQITGHSLRAVENARTRLRKKLNITNSNIDLAFYLSSLEF